MIPDHFPELKYPPIARAAHVQGDVVVRFQQTPDGGTADVSPISGPLMLQGIAVENVKAWHFPRSSEATQQSRKVTFHFQLDPPKDGYDHDSQPTTSVELDGAGIRCPSNVLERSIERNVGARPLQISDARRVARRAREYRGEGKKGETYRCRV